MTCATAPGDPPPAPPASGEQAQDPVALREPDVSRRDCGGSGAPSPIVGDGTEPARHQAPWRRLEMRDIGRRFGELVALDGIDLAVEAGEIVGLLGENGAGKSTLMNVLFGLVPPDRGEIVIDGRPAAIGSPRDAIASGIGMVHQHFMLVPPMTVAENVALALPETPWCDPTRLARTRLADLAHRYQLEIDPDAVVADLAAGQRQRVEIAKALAAGAHLLVLDEPTSVLTPAETGELLAIMRRMAADGHALIFISHKLDEVMAVTDRVVVLRHGRLAGATATRDTSPTALADLMVGRTMSPLPDRAAVSRGPVRLAVTALAVIGDRGVPAVHGIDLEVHGGELFGIAGVSGNGQRELVEAVTGVRPSCAGTITVDGVRLDRADPRRFFEAGVAHIPEDRMHAGIVGNLTLTENAVLKNLHRPPFSSFGWVAPAAVRERASRIIAEFQVQPDDPDRPIRQLSGGNIQKFVVGRELADAPKVIVAAHPTYGVDVGAARTIHERLLAARAAGAAVLVVSEDLDEVLLLADRIGVMCGGRLVGVMPRAEADRQRLGLMMGGRTSNSCGSRGDDEARSPVAGDGR